MTAQARIATPTSDIPQASESYTATTLEQAWNSLDPYQKSVVSRTLVRLMAMRRSMSIPEKITPAHHGACRHTCTSGSPRRSRYGIIAQARRTSTPWLSARSSLAGRDRVFAS